MPDTRKQAGSSNPKMFCIPAKCYFAIMAHFDGSICYRTTDNTFIPIFNSEKPAAGNKCDMYKKIHHYLSFN